MQEKSTEFIPAKIFNPSIVRFKHDAVIGGIVVLLDREVHVTAERFLPLFRAEHA